jgi:DNA-binding MarR family transcriptional regulator
MKAVPVLAQADYETLAAFRHVLRRFLGRTATAARAAGLTPRQHQALLAIKGHADPSGLSIGALAERLLLRHHSTSELVDRLLHAGLAERQADPMDRRRILVRLTPRAEQLMAVLSATHLEELRRVRPSLARMLAQLGDGA